MTSAMVALCARRGRRIVLAGKTRHGELRPTAGESQRWPDATGQAGWCRDEQRREDHLVRRVRQGSLREIAIPPTALRGPLSRCARAARVLGCRSSLGNAHGVVFAGRKLSINQDEGDAVRPQLCQNAHQGAWTWRDRLERDQQGTQVLAG
jgi:hypothetical protein